MTNFYLIRHGETDWNITGRWQGHADIPLNAAGRAQAERVAQRLEEEAIPFSALYSSDLLRAWDTARAIGDMLSLDPVPVPDLREIDIGWWSGLTRAEIAVRDLAALEQLDGGADLPRGSAESMTDLYHRASAALDQIAARHAKGNVLIVAHGGTIRALIEHARTDGQATWPWPFTLVGNTSISIISQRKGHWQLHSVNDTAHVEHDSPGVNFLPPAQDDVQQV